MCHGKIGGGFPLSRSGKSSLGSGRIASRTEAFVSNTMKTLLFAALLSLPVLGGGPASIEVVGVAEERLPPDQLRLSCSIRNEGEALASVASANRGRAAEITKLLRELGLGEAELKTGSASFGEHTEYRDGRHVKLGYAATTTIQIATDKLSLHDKLWFELAKFPEVSISASFDLKDRTEVRSTARKKALRAARRKAVEMATALDTHIGLPLSIAEEPASPASDFINNRNSIDAVLSSDERRGPIEPGLISVVERVKVTFELVE